MQLYIYICMLSNSITYINMEPLRCDQSNIHILHVRGIKYASAAALLGHDHGFT